MYPHEINRVIKNGCAVRRLLHALLLPINCVWLNTFFYFLFLTLSINPVMDFITPWLCVCRSYFCKEKKTLMCITGYMPKDDNTSSTSHPVNLVTKTTPYLSSHYPHAYVSHYSIVPCPVSLFPITRTLADVQQQEKGVLPSAPQCFPRLSTGDCPALWTRRLAPLCSWCVYHCAIPCCYTCCLYIRRYTFAGTERRAWRASGGW